MGKRKLAATISGLDHSTSKDCYSNRGIKAHLRGWDKGIEITMWLGDDEELVFEIYETGGSHNPGHIRELTLREVVNVYG
jgi:hypothetical protein